MDKWDETQYLRDKLEEVMAERDKYEKLYMQLFGLLLHTDKNLRKMLFDVNGVEHVVDTFDD